MSAKKLTARQQQFLVRYIANDGDGPAAYRQAYATSGNRATIAKEVAKLLRHPLIAEAVEAHRRTVTEALTAVSQRVAHDLSVSRERQLERLAQIAYGDFRQLASWDDQGRVTFKSSDEIGEDAAAMVAGIEKVVSPKGAESTKLKTHSALAASDQIAKLMGWYAPEAQGSGNGQRLVLNIQIDEPDKRTPGAGDGGTKP